ncbi:MAG: PAS domain S-box protein [Phycisphaerae bacterium]|nr:PAS domain S-box protein [Phycisphaerae bacterium]
MADVMGRSEPLRARKKSLNKTYLIIALAAVLVSLCLGYVCWVGNEMVARQDPQARVVTRMELTLLAVCLLTTLAVGGLLIWLLACQMRDRQSLRAANQELEASNQQLQASEQHLQTVNQQLAASEQQAQEERDRAESYFSLAGTMLVVLDTDGRIERINQKGCEILGDSEQNIVGKDWFQHFLPDTMRVPVRNVFDQIVAGHVQPMEFYENPIQTMDGKRHLVAWHNTLLQDESGHVMGVLTSGEDITERKEAEQKIQTFKYALDSSSDAIGMSTPEGRHIYQNHTFDTLFGDVGSDPPATLYVDPSIGREVFDTIMNGDEWAGEVDMYHKHGEVLNILLRAYPVKVEGNIVALMGVHTDFTQRKRAEEALQKSELRLRQLIEAAPYGAFEYEYREDNRLVFVGYNQAANRILNADCAQFMGKTIEEAFPPLAETEIPAAYRRVATTGQRYEDEQVAYAHDQITGAFEISAFQTAPRRMAVLFRDITERKRATEALEKERKLIVRLMETSPVGIVMTDAAGLIQFANAPAEHILGLTTEEIMGRTHNDIKWHITDYDGNPMPDEHLPFSLVRNNRLPVYGIRHAIAWPDGRRTLLSVNATPLLDPEGKFTGMVSSVEDVTQRVQAEKKVLQYQNQLRALVSQLTLSEERERKRLAVELHDGICQSLAMAKLKVDEQLMNHSPSAIQDLLQGMQQTLVSIINDTRSLTNNLGTPLLQQMGLHVAIEKWLDTEITAKHGIKTQVIDEGVPKTLNDNTKALLFRAVRELATNVVKHAQAQTLTVTLGARDDELHLITVDDGRGFDYPALTEQDFSQGGYGLFSIHERITYVGGDMSIDSSPGKGTRILLRLPLNGRVKPHKSPT